MASLSAETPRQKCVGYVQGISESIYVAQSEGTRKRILRGR